MRKKYIILVLFSIMFPFKVSASTEIENQMINMIENIDTYEKKAFLNNHPVGSIYMTTNSDESTIAKMKSKYGGTWEVYAAGRTLIGVNSSDTDFSTVGKTGGSKSSTVSVNNLPSHNHSISHTHTTASTSISSSGAHSHTINAYTINVSSSTSTNGKHTHGMSTGGDVLIVKGASSAIITSGLMNGDNSGWWNGHYKNYYTKVSTKANHTHKLQGTITSPKIGITANSGSHYHTISSMTTTGASTSTSGNKGNGKSITNLDPYITVYMYKRTA